MREIKFRAWFEKDHRWLMGYEPGKEGCNILGEMILIGGFVLQEVRLTDLNEVVVEQFTGLRDRLGCEIYEGDICRFPSGMDRTISFDEGGFGYIASGYFIGFAGHGYLQEIVSGCEVIGNIHENTDLLNAADSDK